MIRRPIPKYWYVILGIVSTALLLWAYQHMSYRQHVTNVDDTTIPTWTQMWVGIEKITTPDRAGDRWIVVDSLATGSRFFMGLFYGIVGSVVIGVLMGCFCWIEGLLWPPLAFLAKIPPTAALAVFFVLVGTDTEMYVAMIAFGVLPTLAQTIYLSVREVPDENLYKAYTLGASHTEVVWNVVIRHVLPKLLDAIRLQIGPALVYLIAAEMAVGHEGFGYRIRLQMKLLNMSAVYPYLVCLAAFGFSLDYGMRMLQRVCCPWYAGKRSG